jgi:hypothetical protein
MCGDAYAARVPSGIAQALERHRNPDAAVHGGEAVDPRPSGPVQGAAEIEEDRLQLFHEREAET